MVRRTKLLMYKHICGLKNGDTGAFVRGCGCSALLPRSTPRFQQNSGALRTQELQANITPEGIVLQEKTAAHRTDPLALCERPIFTAPPIWLQYCRRGTRVGHGNKDFNPHSNPERDGGVD